MSTIGPRDIKALARDGGFKSRKLWALVAVLGAASPLAWDEKLTYPAVALFLGVFAIYCTANVLSKTVLVGGALRSLLTSAPQAQPVTAPKAEEECAPLPPRYASARDFGKSELEKLRRETERINDLLHQISMNED